MTLRTRWAAGDSTLGVWLMGSDPVAAEMAAHAGYDYVCVDSQHGTSDYAAMVSMVRAIELGGCIPLARVPWNEPGVIGRTLDAGVHGVVVPMVNTAAQAEAVVRACRYAPAGARSFGPVIPGIRHGDAVAWAHENVTVIPMIETTEALSNLDAILSVPGIDGVYVGPADLSLTLGLAPRDNDGNAEFDQALADIVEACRRHGVTAGIHSSGTLTKRRLDLGFSMVTVTSEIGAMSVGLAAELRAATRDDGDSGGSLY